MLDIYCIFIRDIYYLPYLQYLLNARYCWLEINRFSYFHTISYID